MLKECECLESLCRGEIKGKLQLILKTLGQEECEVKQFYHKKISELYEEISEKEVMLEKVHKNLLKSEEKIISMQWKLIQKDTLVAALKQKISKLQRKIEENSKSQDKRRSTSPIQVTEKVVGHNNLIPPEESQKRINISEYFMKAMETSKISTKIGSQENSYNTISSIFKTDLRKKINSEYPDLANRHKKVFFFGQNTDRSTKKQIVFATDNRKNIWEKRQANQNFMENRTNVRLFSVYQNSYKKQTETDNSTKVTTPIKKHVPRVKNNLKKGDLY